MSTKRILGIAAFGALFIAAAITVMLFFSYPARDSTMVPLPDVSAASEAPGEAPQDTLNRVDVTSETIQSVVSELSRPPVYMREVIAEIYWEGGHALFNISVSVANEITALRVSPSVGAEKRIIVTGDEFYIWYAGDKVPYKGSAGAPGFTAADSDEWQMLVRYEDLLELDRADIIEAGYVEFNGDLCVFARYLSPLLGYTRLYYIPTELGLVTGAEEYDSSGKLVYSMSAGECIIGEVDESAFTLPDGTSVLPE